MKKLIMFMMLFAFTGVGPISCQPAQAAERGSVAFPGAYNVYYKVKCVEGYAFLFTSSVEGTTTTQMYLENRFGNTIPQPMKCEPKAFCSTCHG